MNNRELPRFGGCESLHYFKRSRRFGLVGLILLLLLLTLTAIPLLAQDGVPPLDPFAS